MRKYLIEFIGTFLLVFVIALSGNPIAVGAMLTALIYMGGYISGGHFNPAVSLAVWVRGKMGGKQMLGYMLAQVLGGALAGGIFWLMAKAPFIATPGQGLGFWMGIVIEAIFTFGLASVVLHTATSDQVTNNYFYGIAIGLALMAGSAAAAPISGGVLNPAVAVGPMLMDIKNISTHFSSLMMYIFGPLAGGALAAGFYYLTADKKQSAKSDAVTAN